MDTKWEKSRLNQVIFCKISSPVIVSWPVVAYTKNKVWVIIGPWPETNSQAATQTWLFGWSLGTTMNQRQFTWSQSNNYRPVRVCMSERKNNSEREGRVIKASSLRLVTGVQCCTHEFHMSTNLCNFLKTTLLLHISGHSGPIQDRVWACLPVPRPACNTVRLLWVAGGWLVDAGWDQRKRKQCKPPVRSSLVFAVGPVKNHSAVTWDRLDPHCGSKPSFILQLMTQLRLVRSI